MFIFCYVMLKVICVSKYEYFFVLGASCIKSSLQKYYVIKIVWFLFIIFLIHVLKILKTHPYPIIDSRLSINFDEIEN